MTRYGRVTVRTLYHTSASESSCGWRCSSAGRVSSGPPLMLRSSTRITVSPRVSTSAGLSPARSSRARTPGSVRTCRRSPVIIAPPARAHVAALCRSEWHDMPSAFSPSSELVVNQPAHRPRTLPFCCVFWNLPVQSGCSIQGLAYCVHHYEIHHRGELSLILGSLGREGLDV